MLRARAIELALKRKKNPQLAILALQNQMESSPESLRRWLRVRVPPNPTL